MAASRLIRQATPGHNQEGNSMNLMQRLGVVLGSVVTLVTALAVAVNEFIGQLVPALPDGWQDNAVSIGGTVVTVLLAAAAAVRRLTEVPASQRGLLPSRGLRSGGPVGPSSSVRIHVEGSIASQRELVDSIRRGIRRSP